MSADPRAEGRRVGHLTIIPPHSPSEFWADWKARGDELEAEEAEWAAEEARLCAREQAITRLLLGAVGMYCLGVVLMLVWPVVRATFGGAP